jgi:hypothetical protein
MADPKPTSNSLPARAEIPAIPARWGFWKGLVTGAAVEIPVLAATVWALARTGYGDKAASFMHIMRLTTVFAGVAALLTAGGIGRLAARASATGGRRRAVWVAARAHAVASAGLVIIAAIPHGHLPAHSSGWYPLPLAGLVAGLACGAVIGAVCGGATPVGFADVWSLARKPTVVLQKLLSPEDLVRLGTALGSRTRHLFEGMFEPAPLPPAPPKPSEPPAEPPTAVVTTPSAKDE